MYGQKPNAIHSHAEESEATFSQLSSQLKFDVGTEWYYRAWHISPFGPEVRMYIDRDTIIGQNDCTIMRLQIEGNNIDGSEIIVYEENDQIFFYEEDTFYKLYDFSSSISIGDTIEYYLPANANLYDISSGGTIPEPISNPYYLEIIEIDSVLSEELVPLKRYGVNSFVNLDASGEPCNYIYTIIEGIGSIHALFRQNCAQLAGGHGPYFRCYLSDSIHYRVVDGACDLSDAVIDSEEMQSPKIHPNPFTNSVNLINKLARIDSAQILNHMGLVVVKNYQFGSDLSELSPGFYFVVFEIEGKYSLEKIVKH